MNVPVGIGLIVGGAAVGSLTALVLWRRVPAAVTVPVLAAAGVVLGAGAVLVQDHATAIEWAVALAGLGVLVPVHVRVLFGPPGGVERPRVVADGPPAA